MSVVVNTFLGEIYYLADAGVTDHDTFYNSATNILPADIGISGTDWIKIGTFSDDSSLKVAKDGEVTTSDGKSISFGYKSDISLPIIAQDDAVVQAFEARVGVVQDCCLLVKYTNRAGGLLIRPNAWIIEEDRNFGKNAGTKFTIVGSTKGQTKGELRKDVTIVTP